MAVRRACATGGTACHRLTRFRYGGCAERVDSRICATASRARVGRGPQYRYRISLGRGTHRAVRRPGGNVTGLSSQTPDAAGKKLEVLRQVVPDLRQLATLADVGNPYVATDLGHINEAARTFGIEVTSFEIRRGEELDSVFEALKQRTDALYVLPVPLLFANRVRINTLALVARLPTLHGVREYVEAGGPMSYGPNWPSMWRRAADLVDKILRGAKPAEIPVEQPTEFDLVINLPTAKKLGLTIPDKLLALANAVIE